MVDRIKFSVDNAAISEDVLKKMFFAKMTNKKGNSVYLFRNNFVEDDDEEGNEEGAKEDSYNQKYKKYLYIKYVVYAQPKNLPTNDYSIKNELIVHRNLRKDILGEGVLTDLNFSNFVKVVEGYIEKFGIANKTFWNARVTKLELGVTLKLKSKMRGILSCFDNFRGITTKHIYGNDGIAFIGENFSISIYDKLEKMWKNDELFNKSRNKKKLKDKVSKNNYFLRLELKIEKVSGFYRKSFDGKIDRLKDIRDNWNYLGGALLELYSDINYLNVLSPAVEDSISGEELKPMDKFLKFKGIKAVGESVFFNQILPLMKGGGVKFRKRYQDFYNDYERKYKVDYEGEFSNILKSKIEKSRSKG